MSAAGVRAGVDKTAEDRSGGRRKLYRRHGYRNHGHGPHGVPQGVPVNFNDENEASYYNEIYNNQGRAHAYAYDNYDNYGEGYGGGPGSGYSSTPAPPKPKAQGTIPCTEYGGGFLLLIQTRRRSNPVLP